MSTQIANTTLGNAFLLLTAHADAPLPLNPLVGTSFNATISYTVGADTTFLGTQSGIVTPGQYELQTNIPQANNGYIAIDLDRDPYARLFTTVNGLYTYYPVYGFATIHIEFPDLSALAFSGLYNFQHDSAGGFSGLSVGTPVNSLDFVFAGNFIDPYGLSKGDGWGFAMGLNPATPPDQPPGAGNGAVPEPSTYGLFAAIGLAGLSVARRRNKKPTLA